ncbi:MAG: polynucleotide adenylyltransferase [Sphingomonas bacterium]|uniref:CCA tRNA nucleotidyltransferase n=1 Tax=Sphingomonas bacterium TaxID=1895847 RepID=UPI00261609F9|nr:CCA tRNA nucleotidyltransferase [Sphingomonas bacterium]MDB5707666.1 polynucleotide adenylyltransferase [Sphingomonas bacterium]
MERVTLPRAAWREREGLAGLCDVLGAAAGKVRFVGGAVRDTLLGIDVADIDLATTHSPERVIALLKGNAIKVVPTGLAHGTVTAVLPGGPVEVTTLRCDVATDGRHATVAFTDDWREDAARRDFTMNALYADPRTGEIFDYFGGIDDLEARRVRFIGDPLKRIAEDHLRILRFFRFHARFGDEPDAAGLGACTERANDLMALSRERIAAELLRLLVAVHAVRVVRLMIERGIFAPVLPEIDRADRLARLVEREAAAGIAPDPIRRLAALLPADQAVADDVGARLKLSKADRKRLINAAVPAGDEPAPVIAYRLGTILAIDRLLLSDRPESDAASLIGWQPSSLPLGGGALVERGVRKGPEVARMLRMVEEQWIAEGFPDAARVAVIADETVAQLLRASSME